MLSKSKGQILRVASCLHVLFTDSNNDDSDIVGIPSTISKEAIVAAQNFVETCCQHAAFMAGRDKVEAEISELITGYNESIFTSTHYMCYKIAYLMWHTPSSSL